MEKKNENHGMDATKIKRLTGEYQETKKNSKWKPNKKQKIREFLEIKTLIWKRIH